MSRRCTYRRSDHPYPDYVDSIHPIEHKWLVNFLRLPKGEIETLERISEDSNHSVDVFDVFNNGSFTHGSIPLVSCHPSNSTPTNPKVFEFLNSAPDECLMRIIVARERAMPLDIHRGLHNALGFKYNLSPRFFELHFALFPTPKYPSDLGNDSTIDRKCISTPSQCEENFLQIKGSRRGHLTATEIHAAELQTLIVLDSSSDSPSVVQSVLRVLNSFSDPQNKRRLSLIDICGHYSRECLRKISGEVFKDVWDCLDPSTRVSQNHEELLQRHDDYRLFYQCLLFSSENICNYLSKQNGEGKPESNEWKVLLTHFDAVIKDAERVSADLKNQLQVVQSRSAIEEARLGVRQAESVRRLTFVAFVFIPLSFATSFFGMNVTQLKGDIDVKWFVLTAVISGLVAAIIAGCVKFTNKQLSNALARLRAEYKAKYVNFDAMQTDSVTRMIYNKWIGHYLWKQYHVAELVLALPNANDPTCVISAELDAVPRSRVYRKVIRSVARDMLQVAQKYLVPRFCRARSRSTEAVAV